MRYEIIVRGKRHEWMAVIPEAAVEDMREDGFEVVEVHNSFPAWLPNPLEHLWVAVQDIWSLPQRLLRKKK